MRERNAEQLQHKQTRDMINAMLMWYERKDIEEVYEGLKERFLRAG